MRSEDRSRSPQARRLRRLSETLARRLSEGTPTSLPRCCGAGVYTCTEWDRSRLRACRDLCGHLTCILHQVGPSRDPQCQCCAARDLQGGVARDLQGVPVLRPLAAAVTTPSDAAAAAAAAATGNLLRLEAASSQQQPSGQSGPWPLSPGPRRELQEFEEVD